MEKSFRVRTNITGDTLVNVNMRQDFDFLEILSLKLRQKDAYRLHSSNYGVIVGRVLANDAFGVPNAKVSVFIERDADDSNALRDIYPYSDVMSKDKEARRYNLLPDYSDDSCYRVVGTFPRKRYLLDDDIQVEVYEKYWKFTTVTNQAGDYMIFGVPEGSQQVHVDIDLSDIGILSQRPRDFVFKGYDINEFDSPSQFKESTNLDGLQQIISQNKTTNVYPFWGDPENGIAAITRCDIQVNYKFEPTCVFIGSIVSDNEGNSIGHKCAPSEDSGLNNQLIAGEGTIEMIRKTQDGLVEEFPIKGNALIDSDGVWCYQIPMNLDYVGTDEYGNIVPTEDPGKGIPTRTQVRFRISKRESGDEGFSRHTAKYLVPMNPIMRENKTIPTTQEETGQAMERMYNFGSNTPQSCFRDLYWNNVYSVKNYIPKVQVAHRAYSTYYGALKGSNLAEDQNPIPFNKLRVDMPFSYMIVCIIFTIVMIIVHFINLLIWIMQEIRGLCIGFKIFGKRIEICPFKIVIPKMGCISLNAGLGDGSNVAYYPGCHCPSSEACKNADCPEGMEGGCTKSSNNSELKDKIQQALALDYKIIKLDFYQDWLNGCLYMPLWFWRKRKKKTFLFFTISGAKNEFCDCDKEYSRLKTYVTCDFSYRDNSLTTDDANTDEGEERWHKKKREWVRYRNGLIKGVENKDGLTAYYYVAYQPTTDDPVELPIDRRTRPFQFARLYATDIILLGNLNESNLYGIPQFFKALPSTTANLPPIATIQETLTDEQTSSNEDSDTINDVEDSGTTITTGMDWGYDGDEQTPLYKNGLFMDLTCTYVGTKAKSCINVERLSELGVNLDSTYEMTYAHNSNDLKKGVMDSDGFINKLELDDLDNRATFATLNHIGFIPQDYQDSIDGYSTQIQDENTGYLVPKFKYIYPVDFDGRLAPIMRRYRRGFEQAMYDEQDQSYITFRLGAESNENSDENLEGRIRHYYYDKHNGDRDGYHMPLYNNSFYFYFGINKGNTAIDKFNKLFFSPCFQRNKSPFSFNIESMGKSYCVNTYGTGNTAYNGYGYIRFTSDDIIAPFSYTLYDSTSNLVVPTETGMTETDFVIGGYLEEADNKTVVKINDKGIVKYQHGEGDGEPQAVDNIYGREGLTNQVYTLEITDANGRKLSERIELKIPKISIDFDTDALKTKFYSTGSTRMDYICNDENKFYGLIRLKGFSVDGSYYYITGATVLAYDSRNDAYKIQISGVNVDNADDDGNPIIGNTAYAIVRVAALDSPNVGWVRDCMCDTGNTVYRVNGENSNIADVDQQFWFGLRAPGDGEELIPAGQTAAINKIPTLFVYQPNRFTLTISQLCEDEEGVFRELEDNTTSDIATVSNGLNFNTFLNEMPVKFMLGTTTDSKEATVANNSFFYSSDGVTSPKDRHISGWYGLHQEESYRWEMSENQVLKRNEEMWSDYVQFKDITTHEAKGKILEFKFNSMFSLASAAHVIDSPTTFYHEAKGGVTPTLYRSVVPKYSDYNSMKSVYVLADDNMVSGHMNYPNIVGNNYSFYDDDEDLITHNEKGPNFNKYYSTDTDKIGNYFAAFTNNGGYTSKTEIDTSLRVAQLPTNAKVSPKNGGEKRLGRNEEGRIGTTFAPAFNKSGDKYQPYLRSLFVDRRLDFNLTLVAPCVANNTVNLYPTIYNTIGDETVEVADPREKMWRSARISGFTYNGVEMSYDRDYNIISADVVTSTDAEGKITATATPNRRLEYSYVYSDGDSDAKTVYNTENDMIWEEDAYGIQKYVRDETEGSPTYGQMIPVVDDNGNPVYEEGKEPKDGQIVKRFYEATFVGGDIRNFFWSNFNKKRLSKYTTSQQVTDANYVYKYPSSSNQNLYNGDFTRTSVINNNNYPTKRYIDVGNILPGSTYDLDIYNCSYAMTAHFEDDNTITSEAREAEGITVSTQFSNPISFVAPNDESGDYANAYYKRSGSTSDGGVNYVGFVTSGVSISFVINPVSNDDFNVYTGLPKMIRVMPYKDGYDGITYIKTATPNGEVAARGDISNAVDEVTIHVFDNLDSNPLSWLFGGGAPDTIVPSGVDHDDMQLRDGSWTTNEYYYKDNDGQEFLTSDSSEFQSIRYVLDGMKVHNVNMFAFCVERLYLSKDEDNLQRTIRTFEFGEIYDVRPIYLQVDESNTYVEKRDLSSVDVKVEVTVESDDPDQGEEPTSSSGTGEGSASTFAHIQTLTLELFFPKKDNPIDRACETVANAGMMSYTLNLRNAHDEAYQLQPSKVLTPGMDDDTGSGEVVKDGAVKLKFRWMQDMGIIADTEWQGTTRCSLVIKTGSNFIYRTSWFNLSWSGDSAQEGGYHPSTKTSDNMIPIDETTGKPNRYKTNTKISS